MNIRIVKRENDVSISSEIISEEEFTDGTNAEVIVEWLFYVCESVTLVGKDKKRTSWTYSIAPE